MFGGQAQPLISLLVMLGSRLAPAAALQQYSKARGLVRRRGAFESLEFARVAPNGWDMYVASFAHGKLVWLIAPLNRQGKVPGLLLRPYP